MSGAEPRTARPSQEGGLRARATRRAGSAGREVGARASAVARAGAGGGRAPGAHGPGSPLARSRPPTRAPRLSGTSFACRLDSRVCARGGARPACGRGGERGTLPPGGARAAPPLGVDAPPPAPPPGQAQPAGNKGHALGPKGRSRPHRQAAPEHPPLSLAPSGKKLPYQHILHKQKYHSPTKDPAG